MSIRIRSLILLGTSSLLTLASSAIAQEAATQLETIVVEGETRADTRDTILLQKSLSSTKTDTALLQTPQSVSTITRRQLDDQNPQTVSEALRYTAGVLSDRIPTRAMIPSFFADLAASEPPPIT